MYEYIIKTNNEHITLYHKDKKTKVELLNAIDNIVNSCDSIKEEDLIYEVMFQIQEYGYVIKDWIEYNYSIQLDFNSKKQLKKDIKEDIYSIGG